jgi:hypothetical protein
VKKIEVRKRDVVWYKGTSEMWRSSPHESLMSGVGKHAGIITAEATTNIHADYYLLPMRTSQSSKFIGISLGFAVGRIADYESCL